MRKSFSLNNSIWDHCVFWWEAMTIVMFNVQQGRSISLGKEEEEEVRVARWERGDLRRKLDRALWRRFV